MFNPCVLPFITFPFDNTISIGKVIKGLFGVSRAFASVIQFELLVSSVSKSE